MTYIKSFSSFLAATGLFLFLTACEKNNNTNSQSPTTNSRTFELGKYQNVAVDSGNGKGVLYAFNQDKLIDEVLLDANKDGVDDLKLSYEFYRSLSGGQRVTLELTCLNAAVEVVTTSYNDTLSLCYLSRASYDSVFYNHLGSYGCAGTGSKMLRSLDYTSPTILNIGSQPSNQLNWQNGTFLIKKEDKSSEFYRRLLLFTEQGPWVRAASQYVLFRINSNGNARYGWLKLSDKNLWLFDLEEMAFEKG